MSNRYRIACPALLVSSLLWIATAGANTVVYGNDHMGGGKMTAKEGLDFSMPPEREKPFASLLRSNEEHRAEILRALKGKESHRWDKHHEPRKDRDDHDDASKDDTSNSDYGDGKSTDLGDSANPPSCPPPTKYPPITPTPSAVPVPAALWLFLSGCVGLGVFGGQRRR